MSKTKHSIKNMVNGSVLCNQKGDAGEYFTLGILNQLEFHAGKSPSPFFDIIVCMDVYNKEDQNIGRMIKCEGKWMHISRRRDSDGPNIIACSAKNSGGIHYWKVADFIFGCYSTHPGAMRYFVLPAQECRTSKIHLHLIKPEGAKEEDLRGEAKYADDYDLLNRSSRGSRIFYAFIASLDSMDVVIAKIDAEMVAEEYNKLVANKQEEGAIDSMKPTDAPNKVLVEQLDNLEELFAVPTKEVQPERILTQAELLLVSVDPVHV